jgi:hypothetical protein
MNLHTCVAASFLTLAASAAIGTAAAGSASAAAAPSVHGNWPAAAQAVTSASIHSNVPSTAGLASERRTTAPSMRLNCVKYPLLCQ